MTDRTRLPLGKYIYTDGFGIYDLANWVNDPVGQGDDLTINIGSLRIEDDDHARNEHDISTTFDHNDNDININITANVNDDHIGIIDNNTNRLILDDDAPAYFEHLRRIVDVATRKLDEHDRGDLTDDLRELCAYFSNPTTEYHEPDVRAVRDAANAILGEPVPLVDEQSGDDLDDLRRVDRPAGDGLDDLRRACVDTWAMHTWPNNDSWQRYNDARCALRDALAERDAL